MIGLGLRLLAATAVAALAFALPASAQDKVKIGYAISKTGPNAGGASITQIPNYEMWVKDVNAKGGLKVGDKRLPIEVDRIRRPLELRGGRARRRAPDHPGQGRPAVPAVGHRAQPRGRAGVQQVRLSAAHLQRRHRPRARARQALAQQLLAARHLQAVCRRAGRRAEEDAGRRQDRAQHRHDLDRRRLRHRSVAGRAQGLHRRGLQARLRQELSDRHAGPLAADRRGLSARAPTPSWPSPIRPTPWRSPTRPRSPPTRPR